jgi:hypothetical protein
MKHIIFVFSIFIFKISFTPLAQDSNDKKIQMGIILGTALNLNYTDTKIIETKNPGYDLSIGMNFIKNFNQNLGFNSGIEFDFSSMNYIFMESIYYDYKDNKIYSKNELNISDKYEKYNIRERTQKPIYLSIPTMFIFKTDYIGYNRYFAKFGMRHNIILKEMVMDKDIYNKENARMKISKEMAFYSGSIGVSTGTEWNYSGSSSIQFELGYYYGISNLQREDAIVGDKDKNKSLYTLNSKNEINYETIKSSRNQLSLKISFLF